MIWLWAYLTDKIFPKRLSLKRDNTWYEYAEYLTRKDTAPPENVAKALHPKDRDKE
jgi:hypothetical protein